MLEEFLVCGTLNVFAGLAQLTVRVDLVGQVHSQEICLLLLSIEVALDLVKRLFGAEMRLVVQSVDVLLIRLHLLPLSDLIADEVAVSLVLLHTVVVSKGVLLVHVVDLGVELILFSLATLLDSINVGVEACKSLLVDSSDRFKSTSALVRSVVIDSEGALRAQELRH